MRKSPRCPRCGKPPKKYTEMWNGASIVFFANDGVPEEKGVLVEGRPYCVLADCRCGHCWRLRGVLQITDLHDHDREPAPEIRK